MEDTSWECIKGHHWEGEGVIETDTGSHWTRGDAMALPKELLKLLLERVSIKRNSA